MRDPPVAELVEALHACVRAIASTGSRSGPFTAELLMTSLEQVLDPVCGMLIHPEHAAGNRNHRGTTYHLCSVGCLLKFDGDADAYIAATAAEEYLTWQATVLTPMNSAPPREADA